MKPVRRPCEPRGPAARPLSLLWLVPVLVISFSVSRPAGAALPAPGGEAFYVPPAPLPEGASGDLVWYRAGRFADNGNPAVDVPGVNAWQVLYLSQSARDLPIAVSGTVLVPDAPYADGPRPIVGFGVGTQGMGDSCAASKGIAGGTLYDAAALRAVLARGFAVAVTDYEGLGTPGLHTYVVTRALGHAVLDSVRAAMRVPETGLTAASPVLLWGYSEGGAAVIAAAEHHRSYASELTLEGVAAGGVPADLVRTGEYQEGQIGFGSVFIAHVGFDAAYPELGLDAYLNEAGREAAASAIEQCITGIVASFASRHLADFTTSYPSDQPDWQQRFEENRLGKSPPDAPVYLYHGEVDQVIPLDVGEALRDSYCEKGTRVSWALLLGAEHIGGQLQGTAGADAWLGARMAGEPLVSDCPPLPEGGAPEGDGGARAGDGGGDEGDEGCGCRVTAGASRSNPPVLPLAFGALVGSWYVRRRSRRQAS